MNDMGRTWKELQDVGTDRKTLSKLISAYDPLRDKKVGEDCLHGIV